MQRFVIVVDTQADFMLADGALPVAGADALIASMQAWLAALRPEETAGILFTFDTPKPIRARPRRSSSRSIVFAALRAGTTCSTQR
jgi:nicotinamidase-related amidase